MRFFGINVTFLVTLCYYSPAFPKEAWFFHLNDLTRRQLMTVKFKNSEAVEEIAVSALSTMAVLAVPVLIVIASV